MTTTANARLAGFLFLFYIVAGITGLVLFGQATRGAEGTAATLSSLARHATLVRIEIVLSMLLFVVAVALAVALYALTREVDRDLAILAMCCRVFEGVFAAISPVRTLGLLSIATAAAPASPADAAAATALAGLLLKMGGWTSTIAATCFAVGSTIFAYLFLRGRLIPVWMAWLGVVASVLLLIVLPLQLAGVAGSPATDLVWIPMLLFEVPLGFWLMVRGVAPRAAA